MLFPPATTDELVLARLFLRFLDPPIFVIALGPSHLPNVTRPRESCLHDPSKAARLVSALGIGAARRFISSFFAPHTLSDSFTGTGP